jgi:hypothetical protein
MLDHDTLLADGPVSLQRLKLRRVGPEKLHRQIAHVVELEAVARCPDLTQQLHRDPMDLYQVGRQHRLGFVPGPSAPYHPFTKGLQLGALTAREICMPTDEILKPVEVVIAQSREIGRPVPILRAHTRVGKLALNPA